MHPICRPLFYAGRTEVLVLFFSFAASFGLLCFIFTFIQCTAAAQVRVFASSFHFKTGKPLIAFDHKCPAHNSFSTSSYYSVIGCLHKAQAAGQINAAVRLSDQASEQNVLQDENDREHIHQR